VSFNLHYVKEVPLHTQRKTSISTLIVVGILIALALVLLSFEDVEDPVPLTNLTFNAESSSAQVKASTGSDAESVIAVIQDLWTSELMNL
jgi:hypothetical protein